ncbi:MAG: cytochrome c biogenesis protein CcsA [Verrucomicrobia bacterium]|nr:cytochrome c biogenesis protein CcsA [Verrucomicrobiota bacterium]
MDRWFLLIATLLAAIGGAWGMISVHRGTRSHWTVVWMVAVLFCQLGFLSIRGQLRSTCPLQDIGEILVFLAWALTLFYLLIGPAYRISLLGVFSAPLVCGLQVAALISGLLTASPKREVTTNVFHSLHSATSVLAYGALALAAVAGIMFLVLDRQLKIHHLKSGLFRNLPPAFSLLVSLERLLWVGTGLLTLGVVAGFLMPRTTPAHLHLIVALAVWVAYVGLLAVKTVRGLTGRKLALAAVVMFILSLLVFARI